MVPVFDRVETGWAHGQRLCCFSVPGRTTGEGVVQNTSWAVSTEWKSSRISKKRARMEFRASDLAHDFDIQRWKCAKNGCVVYV